MDLDLVYNYVIKSLLFHFSYPWGVEEYGDWILLTAIANIFGMTDAGLNSVTQNRFSIDYAQKNTKLVAHY